MRSPAGTGVCCPIISLTLATALAVNETGGVFFTSGTVVVAIRISLALKYLNYNRADKRRQNLEFFQHHPLLYLDAGTPQHDSSVATCQRVYNVCVRPSPKIRPSGRAISGIRGLP